MQNRVDPFGNIIDTKARGTWLGNRGVIHNEKKEIITPYKLIAWLICKLEFKGRKREIMKPNNYTELFFMDEATALAAGHRPCFECRRDDANRFKQLWVTANPEHGFTVKTLIKEIDKVLQQERRTAKGSKNTYQDSPANLPNGAFVSINDEAYLLFNHRLYQWTPAGYQSPQSVVNEDKLTVLTPKSIVNTIHAGYQPQISPLPL